MAPSSTHRRGPWSTAEDQALLSFIGQSQPLNWVRIAQLLQSRSPKQCRERYHQNLKRTLNHMPITAEEGDMIERCVAELGKRWADIARRLDGRSDNAVKNWWNGNQNRVGRKIKQMQRNQAAANQQPPNHHQSTPRTMPSPRNRDYMRNAPEPLVLTMRGTYETPLPSPAAGLASPTPSRHTPSLVSDAGTSYTYSPQQPYPPSPLQAVRLPPINLPVSCAPQAYPHPRHGHRLPPMHVLEPSDPSAGRFYAYANVRGQQPLSPLLPPPSPYTAQYAEQQYQQQQQRHSGLPTAPNSPVSPFGETRQQQAAPGPASSRPVRSSALSINQLINAPESP